MNLPLPEVAIISIFYNRENYVTESVESLIKQTYGNLKIIIVDDCSTDSTFKKLEDFRDKDSRLSIIQNQINKGFTQTLIDTINELNVKYVAIHGSGDISLPTRVAEQVKYLEENPEVGVLTVDITNIRRPKFHQTEITLKHLLRKNRITHGAVMFRLQDYIKVGGYRSFFTTRQDKDLWFRMSLVTKIHFLNRKLYTLIDNENSVSQRNSFSILPTYLSVYAIQLIKERLSNNFDSLDRIGSNAGLLFHPRYINNQVLGYLLWDLKSFKFSNVIRYVDILFEINKHTLILIIIFIIILSFL